ncbi:Peptidase_M18 domain-containing protein [Cephalotus follicularis]|uniref:aspartyl aminopeptidase n=1 Tax=Cephalotus follicularis TaxID=3775 RepID=A0A1Q3CCR3_CEPFO|nr:Peptidase_M18 domain-containing protein [Cephalotus follicularis]
MLSENDEWDLKPGGRYFFRRNMSSMVAFIIWEKYNVGNAGTIIVRGSDGSFLPKLFKIKTPLVRVPNGTVNKDGFKPNLETDLIPLLATKVEEAYMQTKDTVNLLPSKVAHHTLLLQIFLNDLDCGIVDIVSIELKICDTQPSCLGGANNEFIFFGRLDNFASSYCSLRALMDSCGSPKDLSGEHAIRMIALFDNEEVGSNSCQGVGAPIMFREMKCIICSSPHEYVSYIVVSRSLMSLNKHQTVKFLFLICS